MPETPTQKVEREAAASIATFMREQAATLPTDSSLRGIALRCAEDWAMAGDIRRLLVVEGGTA